MGKSTDTVNRFYDAMRNGGKGIGNLLEEEFTFLGPLADWKGRETFLKEIGPMAGALKDIKVSRQFEEGAEVCSLYDLVLQLPGGSVSIPAVEWIKSLG